MRGRELGLRKVCGSTNRSLFALLSVEYLIVLLAGSLLGMAFIEACLPHFIELAQISEATRCIQQSSFTYWQSSFYLSVFHKFLYITSEAVRYRVVFAIKKEVPSAEYSAGSD